jgi:hypothetical protein
MPNLFLDVSTKPQRAIQKKVDGAISGIKLYDGRSVIQSLPYNVLMAPWTTALFNGVTLVAAAKDKQYFILDAHFRLRNTAGEDNSFAYVGGTIDGTVRGLAQVSIIPSAANVVNAVIPINILTDLNTAITASTDTNNGASRLVTVTYLEVPKDYA